MATIWNHSAPNDWCHICGKRVDLSADVWYPDNAEHDKKETKYIRICLWCAKQISHAASHPELAE